MKIVWRKTPCDLTKPRIVPYKNVWETSSEYGILVQFGPRLRERIALLPDKVACNRTLRHTTSCVCIQKVVYMKTKDELYQKVPLTPTLPRVVLRSNSQNGLQGQQEQEQDAIISCDQPSGSKMPCETGSNNVDYRIPGVPLSAVEQQNTNRKDKVKLVIEEFENHPKKQSFIQDFKQTKEINEFSKESKDLIADMNKTEIFELYETSSKQQCLDCN